MTLTALKDSILEHTTGSVDLLGPSRFNKLGRFLDVERCSTSTVSDEKGRPSTS